MIIGRPGLYLAIKALLQNINEAFMVHPAGIEPATSGLGNRCSILLSYGCAGLIGHDARRDSSKNRAGYLVASAHCSADTTQTGDQHSPAARLVDKVRPAAVANANSVQPRRQADAPVRPPSPLLGLMQNRGKCWFPGCAQASAIALGAKGSGSTGMPSSIRARASSGLARP